MEDYKNNIEWKDIINISKSQTNFSIQEHCGFIKVYQSTNTFYYLFEQYIGIPPLFDIDLKYIPTFVENKSNFM